MARPKTKGLTPRQREIFEWVKAFIEQHGMPPTVREIRAAFGIKSSSVFDLLRAIERKGYCGAAPSAPALSSWRKRSRGRGRSSVRARTSKP